MTGSNSGANNNGPSVSITGSNVTGATASLSASDNHSLDLHVAAPIAAITGVEVGNFDVFNLDLHVLGVGAGISVAYDPSTQVITASGTGGVILNGEGSVSLDLNDFDVNADGNLFVTVETGAGVSALGLGAGFGINATFDEGRLVVGGNLDVVTLGVTGERTLLRPDVPNGSAPVSQQTFVSEVTRLALIGNSGDLQSLNSTIDQLVALYPGIASDPEFLARVAPALQALGGQDAYTEFLARHANQFCFLAGTQIDMWDGTKKPIEKVTNEDVVVSHDKDGNRVPGRVTRTFQNTSKYILDFHGTMVTPGHAYYCAEGPYAGKHVPLIDILRTDGAVQREDGTLIRASTGGVVGKAEDRGFIWAVTGSKQGKDGLVKVRQKGKIRLATRIVLDEEGNNCSIADLIFEYSYLVNEHGLIKKNITDPSGIPFFWRFTPNLPKPEDYILHMSAVTLEEIYRYGEAEAGFPFLIPPSVSEKQGENFSNIPQTLKDVAPSNIPLRMRKHVGTSTVFTEETTH